jgi:hypothetical protein
MDNIKTDRSDKNLKLPYHPAPSPRLSATRPHNFQIRKPKKRPSPTQKRYYKTFQQKSITKNETFSQIFSSKGRGITRANKAESHARRSTRISTPTSRQNLTRPQSSGKVHAIIPSALKQSTARNTRSQKRTPIFTTTRSLKIRHT